MTQPFDLEGIVEQFDVFGDYVSAAPYGGGHINDTFAVQVIQAGRQVRYLLQRINHEIFRDPIALMDNVSRVCKHLQTRLEADGCEDVSRRALTLVSTRDGEPCLKDEAGNFWRVYLFIEGAVGYDIAANARQAYEAARAFGEFQKLLVDLPGGPLHETIPNFHNTPHRYETFESVLAADVCNRAADAKAEIDFVLAHKELAGELLRRHAAGELPSRATHNDTKLNNVLIDETTDEALCIIDLDTLMPGLSLYDFGDLVRTMTSPAAEDERDLSKVTMRMDMFDALVRGFVAAAGDALTPAELQCLGLGGKVITLECGVRFLTDYLQGDTYFKIHRDGHNLDRCRTQFELLQSMEAQDDAIAACIAEATA